MKKDTKGYKYKFSIVLVTYKTDYKTVKLSVDSILLQKFDSYELIIAEDGPECEWEEQISIYLTDKGFYNYKIKKNKVNLGTVKNYYKALRCAEGQYIKALGAGDCLYDENALSKMYEFLNSNYYSVAFGKCIKYNITEGKVSVLGEHKAPYNMNLYRKKLWKIYTVFDVLVLHDWICGASIFASRNALIHYVGLLQGVSKYCEDLLQLLVLCEGRKIHFLDEYVVQYEYGTGISTAKSNKFKRALLKDVDNSVGLALEIHRNKKLYCWMLKVGQSQDSIVKKAVEKILNFIQYR